ncbi:MAG: hypothetical protein FJ279_01705 [Planctomycetes bacterium]|nr:hypothetical protein [Planctomycetota bacterium]
MPLTADEAERCKALYLGFVTFLDRWVGHLLDALDANGLRDNTVVLFTADHGTELMDKGRFGKGGDRLHPYNTRVPLFIRVPGGPKGIRCNAWVQNLDFTPTLLMSLEVPHEPMDGFNVWPVALGQAPPPRSYVTTGWGNHACVRDDRWAVHLNVTQPNFAQTAQAYDLVADPDETRDVASQHPEVVREAAARLGKLTGPLPATWQAYKQRAQGRTMRTFGPLRFGA